MPSTIVGVDTKLVSIYYPAYWGGIQYSSREIRASKETYGFKNISFTSDVNKLTLLIGNYLAYDFRFSKHIQNLDETYSRVIEFPLPREYARQDLIIHSISSQPEASYRDKDGNVFVVFVLKPLEEKDIEITGQIIINGKVKPVVSSASFALDSPTEIKYWSISNISVVDKYLKARGITSADYLSSHSPKKIDNKFILGLYRYVVDTLEPSKQKQTATESYVRQGADSILLERRPATPEDYADLLIALFRRYGIQARMVEGLIISDNPADQVNYHFSSWVEYLYV